MLISIKTHITCDFPLLIHEVACEPGPTCFISSQRVS